MATPFKIHFKANDRIIKGLDYGHVEYDENENTSVHLYGYPDELASLQSVLFSFRGVALDTPVFNKHGDCIGSIESLIRHYHFLIHTVKSLLQDQTHIFTFEDETTFEGKPYELFSGNNNHKSVKQIAQCTGDYSGKVWTAQKRMTDSDPLKEADGKWKEDAYYNIVETMLSLVDSSESTHSQFVSDALYDNLTPFEAVNSWLIDHEPFDVFIESVCPIRKSIDFCIGRHQVNQVSIPFKPEYGESYSCRYGDDEKSSLIWKGDLSTSLNGFEI